MSIRLFILMLACLLSFISSVIPSVGKVSLLPFAIGLFTLTFTLPL